MRKIPLIGAPIAVAIGLLATMSGAGPALRGAPGERLIILIAGTYDTRDDAVRAGDEMGFGDIQGFYAVRSDDVDGEEPGRWLLATAFRTEAGAASFLEVVRAVGVAGVRKTLTTYRGTDPIGLGQEADPSGAGPLLAPLPAGHPARL